jgi:hypothetical protein
VAQNKPKGDKNDGITNMGNDDRPEYVYIDLARLNHVTGNDDELKQILLQKYIDVTMQWGNDLFEAMGKGDILWMRRVLHQMKPHLTMIGSEKLEKMVNELHEFCHAGESKMDVIKKKTIGIRDLMPDMKSELLAELRKQ